MVVSFANPKVVKIWFFTCSVTLEGKPIFIFQTMALVLFFLYLWVVISIIDILPRCITWKVMFIFHHDRVIEDNTCISILMTVLCAIHFIICIGCHIGIVSRKSITVFCLKQDLVLLVVFLWQHCPFRQLICSSYLFRFFFFIFRMWEGLSALPNWNVSLVRMSAFVNFSRELIVLISSSSCVDNMSATIQTICVGTHVQYTPDYQVTWYITLVCLQCGCCASLMPNHIVGCCWWHKLCLHILHQISVLRFFSFRIIQKLADMYAGFIIFMWMTMCVSFLPGTQMWDYSQDKSYRK